MNSARTNFVICRIELAVVFLESFAENILYSVVITDDEIYFIERTLSAVYGLISLSDYKGRNLFIPCSQGRNQKITMYYSFANNVFSVQIIPQQAIRLSKKYGIYITREFLLLFPGLFNYSLNVVRFFNIR